jgi:L-fuculose-phosphate aldolase
MAYGGIASGKRLTEHELRQEMVRVARLLWERNYAIATDGNLSVRLGSDRLLVTPSGFSKGFLSTSDLVAIGLDRDLTLRSSSYRGSDKKPSSEIAMHLEVYRRRPDVKAVIHAHPPVSVAFSIAGVSLARCVIPEVIVTLGAIPTTEYATPGTTDVPASIGQAIQEHDAVILAHHGSLTVGRTLWEAYLRLEKVEHTAQITLAAHQLGQVQSLTPEAVERLTEKRRELLQGEGRDLCEGCTVCLLGDNPQMPASGPGILPGAGPDLQATDCDEEMLVRQIAQAVVRNL